MEILVDYLLEYENRQRQRREQMMKKRYLRDISNPFDMGPEEFREHYR